MPVSDPENRPILREALRSTLQPGNRVVEGGIGFGDIGALVRSTQQQRGLKPHEIILVGVEIFEPYLDHGQERLYDQIILGDVLEVLNDAPAKAFDLILLIDVLEHFERKMGIRLLAHARRTAKNVLVSCPIIDYRQGPMYGNQYEAHLAQWKPHDLVRFGFRMIFRGKIVGVFAYGNAYPQLPIV